MHQHMSLRDRLVEHAEQGHTVVFTPSNDEPLVAFAKIFDSTDLYSLDVNKHVPENELSPRYELTVDAVRSAGEAPQQLFRYWVPAQPEQDPALGFRLGHDSALWGSTPTDLLPPGPDREAFLLLVTTNYVHLSASHEQNPPLVRGAIDEGGELFTYVVLADPARVGDPAVVGA
jgi:hypothetical protein